MFFSQIRLEEENKELKKTYTDFTIDITLKKLDFDDDIKSLNTEIEWVKERIVDMRNLNNPQHSGPINVKLTNFISGLQFNVPLEKYVEYKKQLENHRDFIEVLIQEDLYRLSVEVENIGSNFDEEIIININFENANITSDNEIKLSKILDIPDRPRSQIDEIFNAKMFTNSIFPQNFKTRYEDSMEIDNDGSLLVKVAKLHPGKTSMIYEDDLILILDKNKKEFTYSYEVRSRNIRKILKYRKDQKI